jgi:hypothetical protein
MKTSSIYRQMVKQQYTAVVTAGPYKWQWEVASRKQGHLGVFIRKKSHPTDTKVDG